MGLNNRVGTLVVSGFTESKYLDLSSLLFNRHNTPTPIVPITSNSFHFTKDVETLSNILSVCQWYCYLHETILSRWGRCFKHTTPLSFLWHLYAFCSDRSSVALTVWRIIKFAFCFSWKNKSSQSISLRPRSLVAYLEPCQRSTGCGMSKGKHAKAVLSAVPDSINRPFAFSWEQ